MISRSESHMQQITVDGTAYLVIEADYHRNGVAGEGFYVGIIANEGQRFLITAFPEYEDDGEPDPTKYWPRVAVVELDMAHENNIYMHPHNGRPGGNAWRGADYYSQAAVAIVETVQRRYEA